MLLMRLSRLAVAALLIATGSCNEPAGPAGALVGRWIETDSPHRHLVLRSNGTFENSGASGFTYWRHEGTFEANGSTIEFFPQRFVSRAGPELPETVEEPSSYSSIFENCSFEVEGRVLVLSYTTYPADAPVPTTMRLLRM
jgi:hypothetical protein